MYSLGIVSMTEFSSVVEKDVTAKPLTDWANEPSVKDLKQDLTEAKPFHDTQISKIGVWLDNLNVTGAAQVKVAKGSSKVVPKLIRKQAEWRYAALSEPFLSSPDLFNVDPVTFEDREAAIQNKLVLNNQFNTQINKNRFIDEYIRTAVDEGTAIVRVGWDFHEEEVEVEVPEVTYQVNPEWGPQHEQFHQLMQESPSEFDGLEEHLKIAHEMTMENGVPIEPVVAGTKLEKQIKTVKNSPTLEICDYRNVLVDPTCKGDLDKASFVVYHFESSTAQLEKDGKYKNLKDININNNSPLSEPDHATEEGNFTFSDEPRKKFVVYEYWGYWDIDNSGLVVPFVAAWVGDTLIRMELNPFPDKKLPFVLVQYLPVRRSIYGEPDGALLEDNQKIIGAVTRGMIDIMGKSANGQMGTRKDALDLTNRRKFTSGQDYEYNATVDPRLAFHMHTYPEIPQSAQFMVQMQNMEAESLTGVKAFHNGISGENLGKTATGVRGALDAASKRELGILRRLAQGMVEVGRKIISMNAEFLSEEETVRVTNDQFVTIRRDDLAGNFDLRLSISTAEEDNSKAQELAFMLQTMGNNMDPGLSKMILGDIANLKKMPDLAKKIQDYNPEPDPIQVELAQLEVQIKKAEVAKLVAEAQETEAKAYLNAAKVNTEEANTGKTVAEADLKNLEFIEQESGVNQERDLEKERTKIQGNLQAKQADVAVNSQQDAKKALEDFINS